MTDDDPTQEGLAATAALHLTTAQVLLTEAESLADTTAQDLSVAEIVAQANVHARIAHASAALAMLTPRTATREQVDAEEAPGLAALQQLADNVGHLTEEIESLKEALRPTPAPGTGPWTGEEGAGPR